MSSKQGVEFLQQIAKYIAKTGFDTATQMIRVTGGGEGRCIAEFTVKGEHLNRVGTLHGGLSATIVDNVTTYALMSKGSHPGVSVSLNMSYLSAAKEGEEIIVDAKTVKAGRQLAFVTCELRRKTDGKVIATGSQTKYVKL